MKKVLIIAYSFPPVLYIGAQRPFRLAKYFPEYGWEPIVLTAKFPGTRPKGIKVIETDHINIINDIKLKMGFKPEKGLHEQLNIEVSKDFNYPTWKSKVIKLLRESISFPDEKKGWYKFACKSSLELLKTQKVDAIISTSPTIISHLIARKLKKKYNIPWIADLRDPWTQRFTDKDFRFFKYLNKKLEIKTLSDADILVSVTKPYVDKIRTLHKNKKMFCITNGYDPTDFNNPVSELTDKFSITYTGTLYSGKRDPSLLFQAIKQLIHEQKINRDIIEIKFYSKNEIWLSDEIIKYSLEGVVKVLTKIPRDEVLEIQRKSQLLLLIRWNAKEEKGDCPAKVYEYLGSKRPIIAIGGYGGIIKDLLDMTNAGKFADNIETLKDILIEYYQEYIENGKVMCQSNDNIQKYSYISIARQYSELLDSLVL